MLIVFRPTGEAEFTRNPVLLSIMPEGKLTVTRMTDIKFDQKEQRYFIEFVSGPFATIRLRWKWAEPTTDRVRRLYEHWWTFAIAHSMIIVTEHAYSPVGEGNHKVFFATYEDAVTIEIAFVDYLREQGISMC